MYAIIKNDPYYKDIELSRNWVCVKVSSSSNTCAFVASLLFSDHFLILLFWAALWDLLSKINYEFHSKSSSRSNEWRDGMDLVKSLRIKNKKTEKI